MNRLYFGDNLKWLSDRQEFPDASVDLVYLDPPFNSNCNYGFVRRETRTLGEEGAHKLLGLLRPATRMLPL
jgi:16S rRNA G966 N2-methylase RsmD